MKVIYFSALDLEGKIPATHAFNDLGYYDDINDGMRASMRNTGQSTEYEFMRRLGFADLSDTTVGFCHELIDYPAKGARMANIFYLRWNNTRIDLWNRAHEEAHAACHLGIGDHLAKRADIPRPRWMSEEYFCDLAGLWALQKRYIEPPEVCATPYDERDGKEFDMDGKLTRDDRPPTKRRIHTILKHAKGGLVTAIHTTAMNACS